MSISRSSPSRIQARQPTGLARSVVPANVGRKVHPQRAGEADARSPKDYLTAGPSCSEAGTIVRFRAPLRTGGMSVSGTEPDVRSRGWSRGLLPPNTDSRSLPIIAIPGCHLPSRPVPPQSCRRDERPGYSRVTAICNGIRDNVDYVGGVSDKLTSAFDTATERAGVCRDFAHLAISFCRARGIPARYVSAYAWKLDPRGLPSGS